MKHARILPLLLILLIAACTRDRFISTADARVLISADTLKFDTVFVTAGSTYRAMTIINDNNQWLRISNLELSGGTASVFKLNVDGRSGTRFTDLEIAANDSVFVFVQVNINPAAGNLPFVLRDSIEVTYNGNKKKVQLEAWGQNAHFYRNKVISADETWNNDLPYVILGSLVVQAGSNLTINRGCRIYVHADAPLLINGTLTANGLKDTADRIFFQGDRLDDPYNSYPASWPGIFFLNAASNNVLNYTVIRNAYQAIGVEGLSANSNPKLSLNECIIDNAYDAGIIAINGSISARNCQISNCGKNLYLQQGGDYRFTHCTISSYGNRYIEHKDPVLTLSNGGNSGSNPLNAVFTNCIFWGENGIITDEVVVQKTGNTAFSVNFEAPLWKVQQPPANCTISQAINNQPPLFDSISTGDQYYNFRLKAGSPAMNKGILTGVTVDLDGRPRPVGLPDLGAFELQ